MKGKIFNAQEVQAIIAGNKTMFREICKRQPSEQRKPYLIEKTVGGFSGRTGIAYPFGESFYKKGKKIFVKERFARSFDNEGNTIAILEADSKEERKWRPAQHMKQEHSRLTLLIKEIGVERLQELTFGDAIREGASATFEGGYNGEMLLEKFKSNWNATHKKPGEKFEASPWVWCVNFEVINN